MKILEQAATFVVGPAENMAIHMISNAASHCFGSAPDDRRKHVARIYNQGHLSVLEHINITMQLRTDIATYKGLTRHRHCAFTIESTHYKGYKDGLNVIRIPELYEPTTVDVFGGTVNDVDTSRIEIADALMREIFEPIELIHRQTLRQYGKLAARNVLPQALAADVTMTTNLREWLRIFDLRKGKENTTNMWKLMELIMTEFRKFYPFFMGLYGSKEV
jgi:thymidylate synthase (FAD)